MEWKMERNGIKTYTVAAIQCNWRCSIYVELLVVSLGLLSHCRNFMSKFGTACRHASISKRGTVASSSSGALLLWSCKARLSYGEQQSGFGGLLL